MRWRSGYCDKDGLGHGCQMTLAGRSRILKAETAGAQARGED
jgi:hypothetical protein